MALLPLGGEQVQVVWSAGATRCRQLEAIGSDAFLDRLAGALPDRFQPDVLAVPPQTFGVGLALARRLAAGNAVLVGESAHRCHPVGGQGLNLCWRDVAVLYALARRVSQGRLPVAALPRRYARARWPDVLLTLAATDLLVRLFSNRAALLLPLRRLALVALRRVAVLRRLSLGLMTDGPCPLPRG
jgi:2-octaprenyl-6-methoxyphenol hydroxylase